MSNKAIGETCTPIRLNTDIVLACQRGRDLAAQLGFSGDDQTIIVIAISEVAGNIVKYAGCGEIIMNLVQQDGKRGLMISARDQGQGISDIERVLQDGYSTGEGLGLGLTGAKRLMDEFEIISKAGQGTTITMRKWKE